MHVMIEYKKPYLASWLSNSKAAIDLSSIDTEFFTTTFPLPTPLPFHSAEISQTLRIVNEALAEETNLKNTCLPVLQSGRSKAQTIEHKNLDCTYCKDVFWISILHDQISIPIQRFHR